MSRGSLLTRAHHDGSSLYVSDLAPQIGASVTVRVRVPRVCEVCAVHVRQVRDGEPCFIAAQVAEQDDVESWWEAELVCHNPLTSYRFLLVGADGAHRWLNGTGLHLRDVPDAFDFRLLTHTPPPEWAVDSVVYQVFPDRFARSSDAPSVERVAPRWAAPARWDDPVAGAGDVVARQLFGGDLDGVREHLDHLERLGATVLYLTPFFPARSNHRYDASSFDRVDPVLGGTAALEALVDEAHRRGIRVVGDLTTNHTGSGHDWFETAQQDEESEERGFYYFDENGDYAAWFGVPSLPKLNYGCEGLMATMVDRSDSVVRTWLRGAGGLDGWRIDVANMTGRHGGDDLNHDVARRVRAAMHESAPQSLLVGEHTHDHSQDVMGGGWDGVMNYSGFTRPVWTWLRGESFAPSFLGAPVVVPRLGGEMVAETIDEFGALDPWRSRAHSFTLVGSHDTTRVFTLVGDEPSLVRVAAGLLLTMPGIPMITYGDEIGMSGRDGEDGRRPMPWNEEQWDKDIFTAYWQLIALRHDLEPLRRGGFRWAHVDDDVLVFVRETAREGVLVHCARSAHEPVRLEAAQLPRIGEGRARFGETIEVKDDSIVLHAHGADVSLWHWKRR